MSHGEHPAVEQDQPKFISESIELAEILRPHWPAMRPSGLVAEFTGGEGGPAVTDPPAAEADQGSPEPATAEDVNLDNFDPSTIPDEVDRQWLIDRHGQMHGDYSRKTAEIAELRREAEQDREVIEGLQNPQTRSQYLRLLFPGGNEEIFDALGVEMVPEDDGQQQQVPNPDDPDFEFRDPRVDQIQQEREQELQARRQQEEEAQEEREIEEEGKTLETELQALQSREAKAFLQDREDGKFTPEELEVLISNAIRHKDRYGRPDFKGGVEKGFNHLKKLVRGGTQQWVDSRTGPVATRPGVRAETTADPSTPEGRRQLSVEAIERQRASGAPL